MAVRGKDTGVTLGQLALGVTKFKLDHELYGAQVRKSIGNPDNFDPFNVLLEFSLRVDGEVATFKPVDRKEVPRIELGVEVEYGEDQVWIELWAHIYVSEAGHPRPLTMKWAKTISMVKWAKTISMEIKGDRPLNEEYLEILTSNELVAYLEEVGPELIRQIGRELAQWELSL